MEQIKPAPPKKRKKRPTLRDRIAELESELDDLQILYETTMEHGTELENELVTQNERMETLQNKMRRYLSPQLYQALVGGYGGENTAVHTRTKLTVYFSDIVGFSDLTDSTEPELLSAVLNSYLTQMSNIALKYGGTIDKFVGDAVMVFFGAPEPMDDQAQAENCVKMALEMREALYQLQVDWKQKGITQNLRIRSGINTGICTVGNFGSEERMDYTIIGNQVNLAARLETAAPPEKIYISSTTYALVEELVDANYVGPIHVKGFHQPVEVWELIGLAENKTAVSSYLQIDENTLQLNALDLDLDTLSDDERKTIRKALTRAMVHLARKK